MEIDFNLDEPIASPRGGGSSEPGLPEGPKKQLPDVKATGLKRLRLPLMGSQPVSFQLQVLATAFLLFLAFATYVAVMDSRLAAHRATHLGIVGEINVLMERMARLTSLAAQSSVPTQQELTATRERATKLLALLDNGGELDGETVAPAAGTLHATLAAVRSHWAAYDKAQQPQETLSAANPSEGMAAMDQGYARLSESLTQLRREAREALSSRSLSRALIAGLGSLAMLMLVLFFRVFNDDVTERQTLLARQRREAEAANAATQAAVSRLTNEIGSLAEGDLSVRATVSQNLTGAIAVAMNYSIGQLALLVRRINDAARHVTNATGVAARTSEELFAASEIQAQEIRRASDQVLAMAQSLHEILGKSEQTADAARRMAALAKTIQADMREAAAPAMEDFTLGVIKEVRLSDAASRALANLWVLSQELAELISGISADTRQQAEVALRVVQAMREIQSITEQTGNGMRSTAISLSELADLAVELKCSVVDFKL